MDSGNSGAEADGAVLADKNCQNQNLAGLSSFTVVKLDECTIKTLSMLDRLSSKLQSTRFKLF